MEQLNRIIEAGVPILQALADNAGVTTSSVMDMIGQGKVSFGDLDKSLKSIATGSGILAGSMSKGAATLTGKLSNLSDAINVVSGEFAAKLLPDLKEGADTTTEFVTSLRQLEGAFEGFIKVMHGVQFIISTSLKPLKLMWDYSMWMTNGVTSLLSKMGIMGNKHKDSTPAATARRRQRPRIRAASPRLARQPQEVLARVLAPPSTTRSAF